MRKSFLFTKNCGVWSLICAWPWCSGCWQWYKQCGRAENLTLYTSVADPDPYQKLAGSGSNKKPLKTENKFIFKHTKHGIWAFFSSSNYSDFPGAESFFAWIQIRIKVWSGSGSITNFFKPWIRICIKMIWIRHTAVHNSVSDLDPHPRFLWIQIPGWEDKTNL